MTLWRQTAEAAEDRKLDKNRIIERLVLERTIASQFCRLLVFTVQLYIFVVNLYAFYPSEEINFAHKGIGGTLGFGEFPSGPSGAELLEFSWLFIRPRGGVGGSGAGRRGDNISCRSGSSSTLNRYDSTS